MRVRRFIIFPTPETVTLAGAPAFLRKPTRIAHTKEHAMTSGDTMRSRRPMPFLLTCVIRIGVGSWNRRAIGAPQPRAVEPMRSRRRIAALHAAEPNVHGASVIDAETGRFRAGRSDDATAASRIPQCERALHETQRAARARIRVPCSQERRAASGILRRLAEALRVRSCTKAGKA